MAVEYDEGRFETRAREPEDVVVVQEEAVYDAPTRKIRRPAESRSERDLGCASEEERSEGEHRWLGDGAYALLRITVGAILLAHGLLKLQDVPAWVEVVRSLGVPMPATMALISLSAEVGGGIALILGLFTRFAAGLVFFQMLTAILMVHAGHGLFARDGGYEFPLTLLMTSVLFVAEGSRRYGLDGSFWRAIHRRRHADVSGTPRPHYVG